MDVTYKYILESTPETKTRKDFLVDFFKNRFDDFMNNKALIMISPDFGNNQTLLQLDIDFKRNETNLPNIDVMKVFNKLNEAIPYGFNLEITPEGCHIISKFTYTRLHDLVDVKHQLKSYFKRVKNLDLDASFSIIPLKRIGYEEKRHFFYSPNDNSTGSVRTKLFMQKNPFDELFWRDYISENLIPDDKNVSYITLSKMLSRFDELMGASKD